MGERKKCERELEEALAKEQQARQQAESLRGVSQ